MQSLGRRSGSKPLIFVLPQKDGPPTFYKVDPDEMYIIRDVAEELKVLDDPSSSSQSVPMSSSCSLAMDIDTDSGNVICIENQNRNRFIIGRFITK